MVWNEQFRVSKLKFIYDHPEQIVLCQWQTHTRSSTAHLLFRMVFLTFFVGIYYISLRMLFIKVSCNCPSKVNGSTAFVYYTAWSLIFCSVAAVSSFLITVTQYVLEDDFEANPAKGVFECRTWFRVHMAIHALALDSSIALIFGYFGYVYFNEKRIYFGLSYIIHLWSGVLMLMDFALSSMPAHLFHVYVNAAVPLVYGFFTWCYYMLGGRSYNDGETLYKILNWRDDPWISVSATLGSAVLFVLVRVMVFGMAVIRDTIFYKYYYLASSEAVRTRKFVVIP